MLWSLCFLFAGQLLLVEPAMTTLAFAHVCHWSATSYQQRSVKLT